jgi:hypothetical protein
MMGTTGVRMPGSVGNGAGTFRTPLYMDVHQKLEGLTAEAVKGAHEEEVRVQERHGVTYHKYWFDEGSGKAFCLVGAPSREAANAVHREAHGLVADELIEVQEGG